MEHDPCEQKNKIYVIDLFSGAGGFTTGVNMAGHQVIACIENWLPGIAMHYVNHPEVAHIQYTLGGDPQAFVDEIRALVRARVPKGATWHLHASPPCQSFSIAQRQKRPASALEDAEKDARSNLLSWTLDVIKMLDPPRWSVEQVPTAIPFLRKHCAWIFEPEHGVNIYNKVYGYEFGAPTMRKRLFMGKGWSFDQFTTRIDSQKRRRCPGETTLGLFQTAPDVCHQILNELNEADTARTYTMDDLAIKTSANKWCTTKSERLAGAGPNKPVPCHEGQGLRPLDGLPAFAAIASYPLVLYKRVDPNPIRGHKTYLDGTWTKVRDLTPTELSAVQGFPHFNSQPSEIELHYYTDIALTERKKLNVSIKRRDWVRGIGNSVIPCIARTMFTNCS